MDWIYGRPRRPTQQRRGTLVRPARLMRAIGGDDGRRPKDQQRAERGADQRDDRRHRARNSRRCASRRAKSFLSAERRTSRGMAEQLVRQSPIRTRFRWKVSDSRLLERNSVSFSFARYLRDRENPPFLFSLGALALPPQLPPNIGPRRDLAVAPAAAAPHPARSRNPGWLDRAAGALGTASANAERTAEQVACARADRSAACNRAGRRYDLYRRDTGTPSGRAMAFSQGLPMPHGAPLPSISSLRSIRFTPNFVAGS